MRTELLVVDDRPDKRADITAAARAAGFGSVTEAGAEEQAYELFDQRNFQVAVIDLQLKEDKEGLNVIRRLREAQPDCRIIALTGALPDEVGVEALQAGAHDFISSKWLRINFFDLLSKRLRMWRGVVEGGQTSGAVSATA